MLEELAARETSGSAAWLLGEEAGGREDAFVVEEEEEGEEDAFVTEEEEALEDDEEELLVQAALDSSPKGLPTAVSASVLRTDEKVDRSPRASPCACSQAAGCPDMFGGSPPSPSTGLHSAPTLAQAPVPVMISVSAKTSPPAPAGSPSVSVQTAVLDSANTWPSVPAPDRSPGLRGVAERLDTAGSRGRTGCLADG